MDSVLPSLKSSGWAEEGEMLRRERDEAHGAIVSLVLELERLRPLVSGTSVRLQQERDEARREVAALQRKAEIAHDSHRRIMDELIEQRNYARRIACVLEGAGSGKEPHEIAAKYGWNCYITPEGGKA
jgi:hypothetical protein